MTTANEPRSGEGSPESPAAGAGAGPMAASRHDAATSRLIRLARVWLIAGLVEAALYVLLYRSASLRGLYATPALLVLVGGAYATWHALRPRSRHDRRHGDRRHASRRE